jgi:hypothetical protein
VVGADWEQKLRFEKKPIIVDYINRGVLNPNLSSNNWNAMYPCARINGIPWPARINPDGEEGKRGVQVAHVGRWWGWWEVGREEGK